jgi:hypothetical protein
MHACSFPPVVNNGWALQLGFVRMRQPSSFFGEEAGVYQSKQCSQAAASFAAANFGNSVNFINAGLGCTALIDTGTTGIVVPEASDFAAINALLGLPADGGTGEVSCSLLASGPVLDFQFGNFFTARSPLNTSCR